jgi:hypothetical protein
LPLFFHKLSSNNFLIDYFLSNNFSNFFAASFCIPGITEL